MVVIDLGKFEAFVFDLDGVITRTAAVHARAWKRRFDEYLASRAARTGEPFVLDLVAREGVEVFDSAVALIREARARGVRTAVASSSRNCAAILRAARLSSQFEVRVDGVDLERFRLAGKPAPDMFLEAARRLGVPPAQTVVFEDATAGVEAARAGSFGFVVGVGAAEHAAALRARGAHRVVADLAEVALEGRPPAARIAV